MLVPPGTPQTDDKDVIVEIHERGTSRYNEASLSAPRSSCRMYAKHAEHARAGGGEFLSSSASEGWGRFFKEDEDFISS